MGLRPGFPQILKGIITPFYENSTPQISVFFVVSALCIHISIYAPFLLIRRYINLYIICVNITYMHKYTGIL